MWTVADLTAVTDAIRNLVADPTKAYAIAGRSWTGRDLKELQDLRAEISADLSTRGLIDRPRRGFVSCQVSFQ